MIHELLANHPLIPIASLDSVEDACWLAEVLLKNNIRIIEVTMRTPVALDAVKVLKQEFKELVVGLGTVINVDDLSSVCKAGADFAVSPGFLPFMVTQAQMYSLPYMPAVSTISEAMQAISLGSKMVKVYPASCLGGGDYLSALNVVLPELSLCPTGGINGSNIDQYRALSFVKSIGMSQLANAQFIKDRNETGLSTIIQQIQTE